MLKDLVVVLFLNGQEKKLLLENSGEIKVRYDTKRIGVINKSVTIQSNAINTDNITRSKKDSDGKVIGGTSIIRIKGEVKKPKTNATPVKPAQGPVNNPTE